MRGRGGGVRGSGRWPGHGRLARPHGSDRLRESLRTWRLIFVARFARREKAWTRQRGPGTSARGYLPSEFGVSARDSAGTRPEACRPAEAAADTAPAWAPTGSSVNGHWSSRRSWARGTASMNPGTLASPVSSEADRVDMPPAGRTSTAARRRGMRRAVPAAATDQGLRESLRTGRLLYLWLDL